MHNLSYAEADSAAEVYGEETDGSDRTTGAGEPTLAGEPRTLVLGERMGVRLGVRLVGVRKSGGLAPRLAPSLPPGSPLTCRVGAASGPEPEPKRPSTLRFRVETLRPLLLLEALLPALLVLPPVPIRFLLRKLRLMAFRKDDSLRPPRDAVMLAAAFSDSRLSSATDLDNVPDSTERRSLPCRSSRMRSST